MLIYLTLPEHNSCPVRATFESLGTEKLEESDNYKLIYKQMDLQVFTKEYGKDFYKRFGISSGIPLSQFAFLIHHPSTASEEILSFRPKTSKPSYLL